MSETSSNLSHYSQGMFKGGRNELEVVHEDKDCSDGEDTTEEHQ